MIEELNQDIENYKEFRSETQNEPNKILADSTYSNTFQSTISQTILPYYKKDVLSAISINIILSIYRKSCKKYGFIITEESPSSCTAYHSQKYSVKSLVSCCLGMKVKLKITSVRLVLNKNPRSHNIIVYVKGVYGNTKLISKAIEYFQILLENEISNRDKPEYQMVNDEEDPGFTCKNESYSYYEFYKILSCDAYTLGKSLTEFCSSFTSQYRNPIESSQLLPQPLNSIQTVIDNTVEAFFLHFNYGKKTTEKVMMYCRPAVEKYIYSKLYSHLILIYQAKYKLEDDLLQIKKKSIEKFLPCQIMRVLELNEILWLDSEPEPYQDAIETLEKLDYSMTPIEKIKCIMDFEAGLQSCVVQYWKGRVELDEHSLIIVIMYALLKAKIESPRSQIGFLDDYLEGKLKEERSVLKNIRKALDNLIK
jgi:Vacuolar sorting protein 9 (VPS9) domain